jgi:hypothetical protein
MKIAFHSTQLGVRGTEVAMFDYAKYNQTLLNNESIILYNKKSELNDIVAIQKFSKLFPVFGYENPNEIDSILQTNKADFFYAIKAGHKDNIQPKVCKTGVHVVFQYYEPHGDVYAYVAKWVSDKLTGGKCPDVPHMFDMPEPNETKEQTRLKYSIPNNAIVFGRHGGLDEFNIEIALQGIVDIVNLRKDVYFVLVNTNVFYNHPQIIHLNKIIDMQEKSNWINCCDGMVHARQMGEIFSCSIGEFSYHGKPVLSCPDTTHDIGHVLFLGDKGLWYKSKEQFIHQINNFNPNKIDPEFYKNIIKPYSPINVMNKFQEVFLK